MKKRGVKILVIRFYKLCLRSNYRSALRTSGTNECVEGLYTTSCYVITSEIQLFTIVWQLVDPEECVPPAQSRLVQPTR